MSSAGATHKGAQARAEQSAFPDLDAHLAYCRRAEEYGIESLLTAFGFHRPEPVALAAALGVLTERIQFMVACRSGVCSPTYFVQQINTLSCLTGGRVCINMVAGHTPREQQFYGDFLEHDARYRRTAEFLTVCAAFWRDPTNVNFEGEFYRIVNAKLNVPFASAERKAPEIYLGGASDAALDVAAEHASCLLTLPDTPEAVHARVKRVLDRGTETGLLVSMVARETRAEAVAAGRSMLEGIGGKARIVHSEFSKRSDSVAFTGVLQRAERADAVWLTSYLWTGAVPYLGAPAIALVGSYDEVASAIHEYRQAGVTQFLFMGWPDLEEMTRFGTEVLPLVRQRELVAAAV
jgi:alkanesulfonate monooxygenase